jgi:ABC-2 type transport system ATP-binding protein
VNEPSLVFLDEPTTGLDPQVRLEIHSLIQELKDSKRTLVLTTHYIEEAERLCDRVAIVDQGKIIAQGSPRELQERILGQSKIEVETNEPIPPEGVPPFQFADKTVIAENRKSVVIHSPNPAKTLVDVVKWVDQSGLGLADIHLKRPTLEDVFIELTGKKLRD